MYIPKVDDISFVQKTMTEEVCRSENQPGINLDAVLGDIETCMQSPECTDHTNPPAGH
jgi:hypothetical protein